MSLEEVDEVIADLEKEKADRDFEYKFNQERADSVRKIRENQPENKGIKDPLRVHFKRPPKTSEEAIDTLKEVDSRYEANKSYLSGPKGSLI